MKFNKSLPNPSVSNLIFDGILFLIVAGSTFISIICHEYNFPLSSAPVQIALLCCFSFNFHTPSSGHLRNTFFLIASAISVLAYSIDLFNEMIIQYVVGSSAGTYFYSQRYTNIKQQAIININLSKERNYLYSELVSKCFDHQIEMIMDGATYKDTMPTGTGKSFIIKLDHVRSSNINNPCKKHEFHKFCRRVERYLVDDHKVLSRDPLIIEGKGYFCKPLGDGFYISIGFPFICRNLEHSAEDVIMIVNDILHMFDDYSSQLHEGPQSCCISISFGDVEGLFTGVLSNYEIEGLAVTHAERYEVLRKKYPNDIEKKLTNGTHCIILQNIVYNLINSQSLADSFNVMVLPEGEHVRDDPQGTSFYYQFIESSAISKKAS